MSTAAPRFPALAGEVRALVAARVPLDEAWIADFCRRWQVRELSLFGSVLRTDFRDDSDVDVLVDFLPDAPWSAYDLVGMREELAGWLGRSVDLVERAGLRNPFVRRAVHDTALHVHVA